MKVSRFFGGILFFFVSFVLVSDVVSQNYTKTEKKVVITDESILYPNILSPNKDYFLYYRVPGSHWVLLKETDTLCIVYNYGLSCDWEGEKTKEIKKALKEAGCFD